MNHGKGSQQLNRGFFSEMLLKIQLTVKLVGDPRVNFLLKLIPISALLYFIFPVDLLVGPIDDAVLIYIGMDLFISLCPQDVVQEHKLRLTGQEPQHEEEDIIDVDFIDE